NRQSGNPLSFTQVSTEENGYLKATTSESLLLQIKKANGFFDMSLLGIAFPVISIKTVNTTEIKQQIKNVIQYYHYPELLRVQIEKNI
ncbi:MAG: hypothetical protein K7J15_00175, partial [Candidatus Regiella insecticola]|nr:hypothetical protein [Candidatus Regiella insecticola]